MQVNNQSSTFAASSNETAHSKFMAEQRQTQGFILAPLLQVTLNEEDLTPPVTPYTQGVSEISWSREWDRQPENRTVIYSEVQNSKYLSEGGDAESKVAVLSARGELSCLGWADLYSLRLSCGGSGWSSDENLFNFFIIILLFCSFSSDSEWINNL